MKNKEIEKFFLEYITNMIGLLKTNDGLKLEYHSQLEKPSKSSWYNTNRTFFNIKVDFNIFPNIIDGLESRILNISYVKNDDNKFNDIWYGVFENSLYKKVIDNISKPKRPHSYGIIAVNEDTIKFELLIDNVGYRTNIKKVTIEKAINKRIKELLNLKDRINSKKITIVKFPKTFLTFDPFNNKVKCCTLNADQVEIIKDIDSVIRKYTERKDISTHWFITYIANYFKLRVVDSRDWSIDNGWGSYTYTYIRHVIDLCSLEDYQKDVIRYIFEYMINSKKIVRVEFERTLNVSSRSIGMVQNRGGYTYVS